ncbi:hypothetical protein [Bathymodiolus thermophilus thioautotrophic gill symbiont]|uniref:Uncharacterized protein n=1 Tax=Bathymodiolus thermophilus thioautotrophic gill symbiont TaxID=2360 RepID=A0A1J5UKT7_9GAMM|nr:hypothetical protein [Bathymodiolus thermophilus thioautotrophic gill symbiont]OIR24871.1 hypothetical protein BGC33_11940 [Bathymodiolus thermophilus thioautotrophic gill symbiont]
MKAKIQDEKIVGVNDYVCFKADCEMCGKIIDINWTEWNNSIKEITIQSGGSDPQYQEIQVILASDCWID